MRNPEGQDAQVRHLVGGGVVHVLAVKGLVHVLAVKGHPVRNTL